MARPPFPRTFQFSTAAGGVNGGLADITASAPLMQLRDKGRTQTGPSPGPEQVHTHAHLHPRLSGRCAVGRGVPSKSPDAPSGISSCDRVNFANLWFELL